METQRYRIVDGAENMSVSEAMRLLKQTDWAGTRTREQVTTSMKHSRCCGIALREEKTLVGFARVISDFSTTYYLCGVVVDAGYQHQGRVTRDAHGLYEKFGCTVLDGRFMVKGLNC